jgi:preprotein translocase subunit SecF
MNIVSNRKIFYAISLILIAVSAVSLCLWGLQPSIDFTGGALIEVSYPTGATPPPSQAAITAALTPVDPDVSVRPTSGVAGTENYEIRMKPLSQTDKEAVMQDLTLGGTAQATENSFDSIGPVLGIEALKKSIVSIILVILAIVLYITWAFRKVSEPVKSWKYGLVAIVSLAHDIIIPIGAFSLLGHYAGYEVDTLFVTALLVVLGFSVHNTIVVFDRVRENLKRAPAKTSFEAIVGTSVSQTFTRSMNTSATVLIALIALYIFGGVSTEHFSLALIIGIAAGTFSSVFIGSPLLVTIESWSKKKS